MIDICGLFIVVKAYVGQATIFGWADNRRLAHEYATYFT